MIITGVRIQNYRSFVDAEVRLQPFSLVVGANGSGKSNLLRFLSSISGPAQRSPLMGAELSIRNANWTKHQNHPGEILGFEITSADLKKWKGSLSNTGTLVITDVLPWQGTEVPIFNIDPSKVSAVETAIPNPTVKADGSGTAQVLDVLKNGDREDLFNKIQENFVRYVPEVQKLSLRTVQDGKKQIQVTEKGLKAPLLATELSEGTRLILAILTILHQQTPPPIILLEDIDRGMHPRIFEFIAPLMCDIANRQQVNILATTHNPYLVDCFQDDKEAVIIVEKKDGESTLSTLAQRLEGLDYDAVDPEDMPLGNLWFSGLVGGVPAKLTRRP
jgi:predicted ATPase